MNIKIKISLFLTALISTLALTVDLTYLLENKFPAFEFFKLNYILVLALLVLGIFKLYLINFQKKDHYLYRGLSLLFGLFILIGNSYGSLNSGDLIFGSWILFIINVIFLYGLYYLFNTLIILLITFLQDKKEKNLSSKSKVFKNVSNLFATHPFFFCLIVMLIGWSIYIIAFYPIILSPDPSFQIKQFFNVPTKYADYVLLLDKNFFLTNHHPVLHTLLLGWSICLGRILINDNFGLFIYSFFQLFTLSSVLAYALAYLKKLKIANKYLGIALLIFTFVPVFPLYAMSGVKDTYYTAFIILYFLFIIDYIIKYQKEKLSGRKLISLFIIILLITLFRNNGLYIILFSMPFLIFFSKNNGRKIALVFLMFLSSYYLCSKIILPHFKIPDGSIREALSLPFQQTARYVKYYGREINNKDKEIIDKILGYNTLAKRYDPQKADPVKNEFNKYVTTADLKAYFKVWFKYLLKRPSVYIEATLNNIFGYFSPNETNWYIYYKYDSRITENDLVDYHYNKLSGLRRGLSNYGLVFPQIPGLGLIVNIGFNTWLLLLMGVYYWINKKKSFIIWLIPLYVSLLVCMASPVNTYFRYTMPYIFAMPILLIIWFNNEKLGGKENEK